MKILSVSVAAYNVEKTLDECLSHFIDDEVLDDLDIMVIDDGSKDNTLNILNELAGEDDHVRYISFSRNFGKEAAMYAGFCNADGDYVAVMDADMQDPPALLPKMLKILESGEYDSVATRRSTRMLQLFRALQLSIGVAFISMSVPKFLRTARR